MADNENQAPPPITNPPSAPPPSSEHDQRMWCMFCHLSALAGYIGIPFGNIIGPLIVWQIKKAEIPPVDAHGKAALNFQITVTLALIVTGIIFFIGSFFCVGWLLFPVLGLIALAGVVFPIIAGIKANNGENYKYPWSLELVK